MIFPFRVVWSVFWFELCLDFIKTQFSKNLGKSALTQSILVMRNFGNSTGIIIFFVAERL